VKAKVERNKKSLKEVPSPCYLFDGILCRMWGMDINMISVSEDWNPKQALLKDIILKPDKFNQAKELCLDLHSLVHTAEMSGLDIRTLEDELLDGLDERVFRTMLTDKTVTIAWDLWHLTRIEDITANILIANDFQVINSGKWLNKMNVTVCDTGNAMTKDEISVFSSQIDMNELKNYRVSVGIKTREIINQLNPNQMKSKIEPSRLQRVLDEGGVLEAEESSWLLDFWGKKTVAGILLMPITRHQVVHINDALKIKDKCRKKLAQL
jgi:hypothetical protein